MANVPSRVADRIVSGIKRFQPILGDKAEEARRKITRVANRALRAKAARAQDGDGELVEVSEPPTTATAEPPEDPS